MLSAEGFIPHYRQGLKVPLSGTLDLGPIKLERGASVAGWVEVEGGRIDAGCNARLMPLTAPGSRALSIQKIESTAREATVREDGFFQLAGIPPGSYSLEIRQEGFAPSLVHPIEVWPLAETFVRDPITLRRPLTVELTISPPLDWLSRPWKVRVVRLSDASSGFSREVFAGPADDQGLVSIPGLAPGRFTAHVADGLDNDLAAKPLSIDGPENARQTISIGMLTVRGLVTLGEEPVAATLWFGGRNASPGVQMESDREGRFHGVLPQAGWWRVDVASPGRKLETRLKVNIEADDLGRAEVEIDLPATRLFGRVLDEAGRPMPAKLEISTDDASVSADADETGQFDVRGLSEGMVHAMAKLSSGAGEWTSDLLAVSLREGEDAGPIELRMRKNQQLSGMVRSDLGPVPGAGILVISLHPTAMGIDSASTDVDGTFTARVPAPAGKAAVIVSPPGHALKAFTVPVDGQPQSLTVGRESGDLEILVPEKSAEIEKEEVVLLVFQNGHPLPTSLLGRWALGHGRDLTVTPGQLAVPEVAPGDYRACLAAHSALAPWQASGWTAPLARCVTGQLAAGGNLRLDLAAD